MTVKFHVRFLLLASVFLATGLSPAFSSDLEKLEKRVSDLESGTVGALKKQVDAQSKALAEVRKSIAASKQPPIEQYIQATNAMECVAKEVLRLSVLAAGKNAPERDVVVTVEISGGERVVHNSTVIELKRITQAYTSACSRLGGGCGTGSPPSPDMGMTELAADAQSLLGVAASTLELFKSDEELTNSRFELDRRAIKAILAQQLGTRYRPGNDTLGPLVEVALDERLKAWQALLDAESGSQSLGQASVGQIKGLRATLLQLDKALEVAAGRIGELGSISRSIQAADTLLPGGLNIVITPIATGGTGLQKTNVLGSKAFAGGGIDVVYRVEKRLETGDVWEVVAEGRAWQHARPVRVRRGLPR